MFTCLTKNVDSNRRTIGYKNRPFYYSSKQIFQPLVTIYEARISAGLSVCALPPVQNQFYDAIGNGTAWRT